MKNKEHLRENKKQEHRYWRTYQRDRVQAYPLHQMLSKDLSESGTYQLAINSYVPTDEGIRTDIAIRNGTE